jgi:hypothetical protein
VASGSERYAHTTCNDVAKRHLDLWIVLEAVDRCLARLNAVSTSSGHGGIAPYFLVAVDPGLIASKNDDLLSASHPDRPGSRCSTCSKTM